MPATATDRPAARDTGRICDTAMLALSTFRRSERAVEQAIESVHPGGTMVLLYVVDVNLSRYFVGCDVGIPWPLREQCESELLRKLEDQARTAAHSIAERARATGLRVEVLVRVGRFGLVAEEIARDLSPELIVTTRSHRPRWVKRLFGSPVDHLIGHAPCPVLDV